MITSGTNDMKPGQSQDPAADERGKPLLELTVCIGCQLRILNVRNMGDSLGYYTRHEYDGSSVIDHAITSETQRREVQTFLIGDLTFESPTSN